MKPLWSRSYYKGPKSNHFDGTVFFNHNAPNTRHSLYDVISWLWKRKPNPWPKYVANTFTDVPPKRVLGDEIRISFVGHVTFLIQTQGLNILTDPIWSKRASPFQFIGPKRVNDPGINFDNLPPIDIVWVSHNHYDHLDLPTLQRLWKRDKPRIITPLGNDTIINKVNVPAEAYDLGECASLSKSVKLHLEPMLHWSARGRLDRNKALWAAMILETPAGNIYFIGDSGYGDGTYFRQAREKFTSFKAALLPIGAYAPRWFMKDIHMNPEETLKAQRDLGNPLMIPTHYDTFPLADESYGEALTTLEKAHLHYPNNPLKILKVGAHMFLP
ncbi:MBL fold metallo-hydrolase [Candidatus Paracaedibacter symbiosus]|uniref:MBL fold metallo-hydrolase n=1 Tax=Candidatus Paracaedibacter symbiosus TaxID=244582 RepID=UPI00068A8076|nr:MBL fold metallo-hydrolase [Candidatus Paracaedibacter symbiosus]